MDMLVEIFTTSLTPIVFLYMFIGVVAGICIGALPGLTATMGVALLLPMTFGMEAAQGILMLLGIYVGAIYGGSISAVLLHTPGTPASAATAIEGYKLSQRGEAGRALGVATLGSYIGGVVSVLCLVLFSPQLAKLALKFSSEEFFLLAMFGLCIIGSFAMKNSLFDVWVMLIAGVVGYFMSKAKVPTSPAILGLILGPMAEKNFRTALLKSGGNPAVFFSTVICWFFIVLIIGSLFGSQLKDMAGKVFKKKAN